jgi:large subunit ribosomal protein L22
MAKQLEGFEVKARSAYVRSTPFKTRRVANLVRGKKVEEALTLLKFQPQEVSVQIYKTIQNGLYSARQKAQNENKALNEKALFIKEIYIDQGPNFKRMRPRAKGRGDRRIYMQSHINVILAGGIK